MDLFFGCVGSPKFKLPKQAGRSTNKAPERTQQSSGRTELRPRWGRDAGHRGLGGGVSSWPRGQKEGRMGTHACDTGNRKSSPASPRGELSRRSPRTARGPSHCSRNGGCHAQVHRTGGASEGEDEEGTWGDPRAQAPWSTFLPWAPRSGCHQHLQINGSPRNSPTGGSIWGGVHGAGVKPTGRGAGRLLSRDPAPSAYLPLRCHLTSPAPAMPAG